MDKPQNDFVAKAVEKARQQDLRFAEFDQHQKHCERGCQRNFEFWCEEGLELFRKARNSK